MAFCTSCGNELTDGARYCQGCGDAQQARSEQVGLLHQPSATASSNGITWKKWLVVGFAGFVVLAAIAYALGDTPEDGGSNLSPLPTLVLTIAQAKGGAATVSYDDLFRNNEQHVGRLLYFEGKIIQVLASGREEYHLRVNVTKQPFRWDDTVFLRYEGARVLEDDGVEFVGRAGGLIDYESIIGQKITIPELSTTHLRLKNGALPTNVQGTQ